MPEMTCAGCGSIGEPAAIERNLAICVSCGVTLVVDGDMTRIAVFDDVKELDEGEMKRLRRAHGAIVRPGKKPR